MHVHVMLNFGLLTTIAVRTTPALRLSTKSRHSAVWCRDKKLPIKKYSIYGNNNNNNKKKQKKGEGNTPKCTLSGMVAQNSGFMARNSGNYPELWDCSRGIQPHYIRKNYVFISLSPLQHKHGFPVFISDS